MSFYKKRLNIFFSLVLLLSYFNKTNVYGTNLVEDNRLSKIVEEAMKKVQRSFFAELVLQITSALAKNMMKKGVDFVIQYFQRNRELHANKTDSQSLDKPPVTPRYNESVQNLIKAYQEACLRKLLAQRNNSNVFFTNLLMAGPAGTGKTTGVQIIVDNIVKFVQENLNILDIVGVVLEAYKGGEIFAKGMVEANRFLLNKIEFWVKQSETHLVIIFLDEMEVLFPNRDNAGSAEKNDLTTTFLAFTGNPKKNIIFIGATNHESHLDPAVRRRFANFIEVTPPNLQTIALLYVDYLKWYSSITSYVYQLFDYSNNESFIYQLAELSMSMAGADIDNAVKKAIEESASRLGFLFWEVLLINVQLEILKKAIFASSMPEAKKNNLTAMLLLPSFTWFNHINSYVQFTYLGFNYEEFIGNIQEDIFFTLNHNLYMGVYKLYASDFTAARIPLNFYLNTSMIHSNSKCFNKYFTGPKSFKIKSDIKGYTINRNIASSLTSEETLSLSVPQTNFSLNKIPALIFKQNDSENSKNVLY
jgi:hypothetical protein